MYSFEGEYKSRPVQAFGGASKKVKIMPVVVVKLPQIAESWGRWLRLLVKSLTVSGHFGPKTLRT